MKNSGRPKLDNAVRLTWEAKVRLPFKEGIEVEKAAEANGEPVAVWIRNAIRAALQTRKHEP